MVWVKICGLTTPADAEMTVGLGADAIGTVVDAPSPRAVDPLQAKRVLGKAADADRVIVTTSKDIGRVIRLARITHPTILQLHGAETPSFVDRLRQGLHKNGLQDIRLVKSIGIDPSVEGGDLLTRCTSYLGSVDGLLFDTTTRNGSGGTGIQHDWNVSRWLRERLATTPVILAGGLNPENVAKAIWAVNPSGVDVSTGVEMEPGRKDPERVESFIRIAREAAR